MLRNLCIALVLALCATTVGGTTTKRSEGDANPVVVMKTNFGTIKIELWPDKAPVTVENFLKYVDEGHYNGTIFHRVIKSFMIQGGGFNAEMQQKSVRDPIKNEANNGLKNEIGTIAMARTGVVDSATSQFFINTKNNVALNFKSANSRGFGYCVFGKVIEGLDVVQKIEATLTGTRGRFQNAPMNTITIKSVTRGGSVAHPSPFVATDADKLDLPARLVLALRWQGTKPFVDGALSAEESGELLLEITNEGEGLARGIELRVEPSNLEHVRYRFDRKISEIKPGMTETVPIVLDAGLDIETSTHELRFVVTEQQGHDATPLGFLLTTRAIRPPVLGVLEDYSLSGNFEGNMVPRGVVTTVRLRVRNTGQGEARDVVAKVTTGADVFQAAGGEGTFRLGNLGPGEIREIEYSCYANQRAEAMVLRVDLEEARPRFNARFEVPIPLEGISRAVKVVRITPSEQDVVEILPAPPSLISDIDRSVSRSNLARPNGLAIVIGVEDYVVGPPAIHAANDALTARAYFENLLGIPAARIEMLRDGEVTLAQFRRIFDKNGWLARRVTTDSEVFVFFSGHGMLEPGAKSAYLMPTDGDANYVRQTGYSLDEMLTGLTELGARSVTVFLDSCFSGLDRQGGALQAGARPLALQVSPIRTMGISVFSAASGSQIASALDDQQHGVFSYYLFKGLGGEADENHDSRVTALELQEYLEREVPRAAGAINREQTPSIHVKDPDRVLASLGGR